MDSTTEILSQGDGGFYAASLPLSKGQVVTRFCPTATSGALHVGHLLNAFSNLFWARRNNGRFFVKLEYKCNDKYPPPDHNYDGPEWQTFTGNLRLLKQVFQGVDIVTNLEAKGWVSRVLSGRHIPGCHEMEMMIAAGIDAAMGTTDLIRGHDWSGKIFDKVHIENNWNHAFPEHGFIFNAVLERMRGTPIRIYYSPLLVSATGAKISKRESVRTYMLEQLLAAGHTRESFCAFAANCFGRTAGQPLHDFVGQFHPERHENLCTIAYDEKLLEASRNEPVTADEYLWLLSGQIG